MYNFFFWKKIGLELEINNFEVYVMPIAIVVSLHACVRVRVCLRVRVCGLACACVCLRVRVCGLACACVCLRVRVCGRVPEVALKAKKILFILFIVQSRGTSRIGISFGPIMLIWFISLAMLGIYSI